jgi:hypothetical protein
MRRLLIAVLLALMGAAAARADPPMCRNGDFPASNPAPGLAKVVGEGRLYFQNDIGDCPGAAAACRQRAYVVTGNVVLTGQTVGTYVCAFFPNHDDGSAGYVEAARLASQPVAPAPPLAAWVGHWANGDDTIDLKAKGAALSVVGNACWPSCHVSLKEAPGGPNVGDLSGTAAPKGRTVVFTDNDPTGCTATLTMVGDVLSVFDNGGCGGQNVTFTGVYMRK